MIFRKTHNTKIKKVIKDRLDDKKVYSLYETHTYWFLFVPVYTIEKFIAW